VKVKASTLRFFGGSILFATGAIAFLWFFWCVPFRNLHSPEWNEAHTAQRRWTEVQKQLHRTGADHDSSIDVGRYGDKGWMEWVIHALKPVSSNQQGYSCGAWPYHLPDAPAFMTNQRLTNGYPAWLAWWETNKDKTQVEWIRAGFENEGIHLEQPLTTNNIIALLKVLVNSTRSTTTNAAGQNRGLLRYNSMRWLRDTGFQPSNLDLATVPAEDKGQVVLSLIIYARWLGEHWNDPGRLAISGYDWGDLSSGMSAPWIEKVAFKWALYLVLLGAALSGWFLLRCQPPR